MEKEASIEIIVTDGEHRLDSRLLAQTLGYEHKIVLQSVRRYKSRLEAKSSLLQFEAVKKRQSRGATHETYYLLTERQCLILTGSLKKGDEALEWQDWLIDQFLYSRNRLRELEVRLTTPTLAINSLWEKRALLFNEKTRIPSGHWCIFNEIAHVCWGMEFRGEHLREEAVPDISVGLLWMKEVRHLCLDERLIKKYPHYYPDKRGMQYANIYPNAWLGFFRDWFEHQYLKEEFRVYVQKHALALPLAEKKLLQAPH